MVEAVHLTHDLSQTRYTMDVKKKLVTRGVSHSRASGERPASRPRTPVAPPSTIKNTTATTTQRKAPGPAESSALWFDGPEYNALYTALKEQDFHGYDCVEKKPKGTDNKNCMLPAQSVGFMRQLPSALQCYSGFDKTKPGPSALTLGQAIQKLYMVRLRQNNELLPMTKMYPFEAGSGAKEPVDSKGAKRAGGTIWVGDVVDASHAPRLRAHRITAMVSIHPRDFRSHAHAGETLGQGRYLHLELDDSKEAKLADKLDTAFRFLEKHFQAGENILVSCIAGLSRSVAVVLDFIEGLETREGRRDIKNLSPDQRYSTLLEDRRDTFARMKRRRPRIKNDNFVHQLNVRTCKRCHGIEPRQPPPEGQKSVEHGAGAYLKEAVAMAFYIYHLRPTRYVVAAYEEAKRKASAGKATGRWQFPREVDVWFEQLKGSGAR